MVCPQCGSEYRQGFTQCSDCDVALVPEPQPEQSASRFVQVLETTDVPLVGFLQSFLETSAIEFFVKNDVFQRIIPSFGRALGTWQFWVPAEREEETRAFLAALSAPPSEPEGVPKGPSTPSIQVTHYSNDGHEIEEIMAPDWSALENEIRSMDRHAKPIIWILTSEDNPESDCFAITGGQNVYHLQICDSEGDWKQAVNPAGGDAEVEIWTSDQGFTTQKRFTWDTGSALTIVEWYWRHQQAYPDVAWD